MLPDVSRTDVAHANVTEISVICATRLKNPARERNDKNRCWPSSTSSFSSVEEMADFEAVQADPYHSNSSSKFTTILASHSCETGHVYSLILGHADA